MGSPEDEAGRLSDEGPAHWVELSSGLWLAETPCTQAQWVAVSGKNPSRFNEDRACPVEQVSWDDCQEFCQQFCQQLNKRMSGLTVRLPTEAEWEYACRAGMLSAFNDGSNCTEPRGKDPALAKLGWFTENSESKTHPVGQLAANAWGFRDMHGNIDEWCQDYYGEYISNEQHDPPGHVFGAGRVIRGGCWFDSAGYCRSAYRFWGQSSYRSNFLGFRLAAGL